MIFIYILLSLMLLILVGLVAICIQSYYLEKSRKETREAIKINNQLREEMTEHIHVLVSELNEKLAHRD